MAKVLPEPIDHFLLQADLTVIVPGPLERELAEQLAAVANVESAGAAMVYRISEPSIRRALDTGRTAGELHALFARHSKTPVPQGLTYLIDDVARRHGQLRVGMAASFVRCEDPALLAQAVGAPAAEQLEMRLLAPTVAVSQAPISEVLAGAARRGLRTRGRGFHRRDRRHPGPRRTGARPRESPRAAAIDGADGSDAERDRRGAAQGGRDAVRQFAHRSGGGDLAAAGGGAAAELGGDRLRRPGGGGHASASSRR